ncbi:hypothetical protein ACL03H_13585 [Saccharopolyspora sp. MS10]|uniref:hypothetical protein n=1 Tax=Saccharopolyspora sp. MS10 TaxID=3385973 RepID=UPI0039A146E1
MASVHGAPPSGAHELFEPARQMRWRVPELALMLGDQAVAQARRAGDRALRLRAEAVALFASNRLGHGVAVTSRAIAAVRDAERAGDHEVAAELRVELACCARTAGGHEVALRVLQPVLEQERIEPALRAHALLELAAALSGRQREAERSDALDEADRLYAAAPDLNRDTSRVLLARVRTARAGHLRRNGEFEQAVRAAEAGLALLDRLGDPAAESGEIRARLVLERVHALLDLGQRAEAVEAASPVIRTPVRAASAGPSGWLRLALATRVHLPSGELAAAVRLFNDAAANAERHKLDCLLTESLSMSSQTHERAEEFVEALATLRRAYAADRRWRTAVHAARIRLLEEFPALAAPTRGSTAAEPVSAEPAASGGRRAEGTGEPGRRQRASHAAAHEGEERGSAPREAAGHETTEHETTGHERGAEAEQAPQTAGRRRADGTGRPQRPLSAIARSDAETPAAELPAAEPPAPEPPAAGNPGTATSPADSPGVGSSPSGPLSADAVAALSEAGVPAAGAVDPFGAQRVAAADPLDEYRRPGEGSVRDAARRLMDTLTSRANEDRRPHSETATGAARSGPGAMPEPRAPEGESAPFAASSGGGKRRAPEPEPAAGDTEPDYGTGRHSGLDVPVGRVTAAPFGEGFPVYDFGSRSEPARAEPGEVPGVPVARRDGSADRPFDSAGTGATHLGGADDASAGGAFPATPAWEVPQSPRSDDPPVDEPLSTSTAPWDVPAEAPAAPDVTAIMPVISVPDHEPPATSVGAVEHLDDPVRGPEQWPADPAEQAPPAPPEEEGRRSRGRTLAEIRESLAEMRRHGREDDAGSRRRAEPEIPGWSAERTEDSPSSGASWADRYLGAHLGEDREDAEQQPRAGGRRRARHADPQDEAGIPEPPRWDSASWGRDAPGATTPPGPQRTDDPGAGLPPNLGLLSDPSYPASSYSGGSYVESVYGDQGDARVSPFERTQPEHGAAHATPAHATPAHSTPADALADPGRPAADRLQSAAELLARHRDAGSERPATEEPGDEVGLADLLAEALLAYENGRRQDEPDGPGKHGRPATNGHPIGLPHETVPDEPGARHRRPASPHEPWTSRGH